MALNKRMMRAGALRHRITIQQESLGADDGFGNKLTTWTTFLASQPAAIEPLNGRERFAAGQVQSEVTTRITVRRRAGISPEMRVLFGSRVFTITDVLNPDELNVWLELHCKEEFSI